METESDEKATRRAPRAGAPAPAPFLDKGEGNVPARIARVGWNRKQWFTRRAVMDRLRLWQSTGYQCLWVTLTSAPKSSAKRLRAHFQALRKRIGRELGFPGMEYVCVDTREGHGVLHMIWAWRDPDKSKVASFYIPFKWLQEAWSSLHGAFHVNVKRIGGGDDDARRLSRYIVAQYCGGQNALVRLSQSRAAYPLPQMRKALLRAIKDLPERYAYAQDLFVEKGGGSPVEFGKAINAVMWAAFRLAWDELVRVRSCVIFGVTFGWFEGKLTRI